MTVGVKIVLYCEPYLFGYPKNKKTLENCTEQMRWGVGEMVIPIYLKSFFLIHIELTRVEMYILY